MPHLFCITTFSELVSLSPNDVSTPYFSCLIRCLNYAIAHPLMTHRESKSVVVPLLFPCTPEVTVVLIPIFDFYFLVFFFPSLFLHCCLSEPYQPSSTLSLILHSACHVDINLQLLQTHASVSPNLPQFLPNIFVFGVYDYT